MTELLCAWWAHRQGLNDGFDETKPEGVLSRAGWARSVAGCSPYLSLYARAGVRREQADAALAKARIHELPAARGCTYIVPAADYALALAAGHPFADDEIKVARRLSVTDAEIEKLKDAIRSALSAGPLEPDALKDKVGPAARSLGPEGVKKGISTTMPVALGLLQAHGEIRRIPVNGRIDQQRYKYALWTPNPLVKWKMTQAGTFTELARRYFRWIGPDTLEHFQKFSGLGVKAAKAAVEPLKLKIIEENRLLLPDDEEAWSKFKEPKKPEYTLVGNLDSIWLLPEGLPSRGKPVDLPGHLILDRGQVVGRWEFDAETGTIAWASSAPRSAALTAAVKKTEAFIREDLGDARGFSLDSPKSRAPRIAALRKAAA